MKSNAINLLTVSGTAIILFALYRISPYIFEPGYYTQFGSGYMVGNGILLLIGVVLIFRGLTRKQKPSNEDSDWP
jgi:hypothetical protein